MQPYFLPYAGYFRLMAESDLFVIYDCVQFPRRSFVHRNKLKHASGSLEWLTLPLAKCPQETRIDALAFGDRAEWKNTLKNFSAFASPVLKQAGITELVQELPGTPVDTIEKLLLACARAMELPYRAVRSSSVNLPEELRGQERILALCEHFKAKAYINSPGGRELYDAEKFRARGVELQIFTPYAGDMASVAQRLADSGDARAVACEIAGQCQAVA